MAVPETGLSEERVDTGITIFKACTRIVPMLMGPFWMCSLIIASMYVVRGSDGSDLIIFYGDDVGGRLCKEIKRYADKTKTLTLEVPEEAHHIKIYLNDYMLWQWNMFALIISGMDNLPVLGSLDLRQVKHLFILYDTDRPDDGYMQDKRYFFELRGASLYPYKGLTHFIPSDHVVEFLKTEYDKYINSFWRGASCSVS